MQREIGPFLEFLNASSLLEELVIADLCRPLRVLSESSTILLLRPRALTLLFCMTTLLH